MILYMRKRVVASWHCLGLIIDHQTNAEIEKRVFHIFCCWIMSWSMCLTVLDVASCAIDVIRPQTKYSPVIFSLWMKYTCNNYALLPAILIFCSSLGWVLLYFLQLCSNREQFVSLLFTNQGKAYCSGYMVRVEQSLHLFFFIALKCF